MSRFIKLLLLVFLVTTFELEATPTLLSTQTAKAPSFNNAEIYAAGKKKRRRKKRRRKKRRKKSTDNMQAMDAMKTHKPFAVKAVLGLGLGDIFGENSPIEVDGMALTFGGDFIYRLSQPGINFKAGLIYSTLSTITTDGESAGPNITMLGMGAGVGYSLFLMPNLELDAGVRVANISVTTGATDFTEESSASAIFVVIEPSIHYYFGDIFASVDLRYPVGITTEGDLEEGETSDPEKLSSDFGAFFITAGVGYSF